MQLLNNRYKIEGVYEKDVNGTVYEVIDLWHENNKVLLKLCDKNYHNEKIFHSFCNDFLNITNIKYKYLLENGKFDVLNVIDNKENNKEQFFYTKEYVEGCTLMNCYKQLTFEDILDIIRQLCDVVYYFRFRGVVYEFLYPGNIYILKDNDKVQMKLRDRASVRELKIKDSYEENSRSFIAPEFFLNQKGENLNSDIYSIGMIFKFLLEEYIDKSSEKKRIDKYDKKIMFDLIDKMTQKDPHNREINLRLIIESINSVSENKYFLDFKNEREKLIFSAEIIARERELNEVLRIDKEFENRFYNKKMVAVRGESGIGKTRLLREMNFRLRMKGNFVYYVAVSEQNSLQLYPIIKILRQMIKNCEKDLIDKYGCELVKIIPELRAINDVSPSPTLNGERERLRLYDRISNFIVDFIKNKSTYIIIDELHCCDIETLRMINYFMNNKQKCPLLFIISYNEALIEENTQVQEIIKKWETHKEVKRLDLLKFNLQETVIMIKNILGINYKPMRFGTRIMNETSGNPRHIEEIIKNLYSSGELYIDEDGLWDLETELSSNMDIPSNVDDAIKNQIDLLEENMFKVAKIVSLFRTSVSKPIISYILNIKGENLKKLINKLIEMKIIDERVEDWGYTYDFYNVQTKKYIYYSIEKTEREQLHKLVAEALEKIYKDGKKGNIDELIYHLNLSNQIDKAINYTIDLAKNMEGLVGNVQAISLWQKAMDLLEDRLDVNKLEVLVNIGRLFSLQGAIEKALDTLYQALEGAKALKEDKYILLSKNIIANILLWRNALDDAERYIIQSKKLSRKINDTEGYLEASLICNRLYFLKNQYNKIYEVSKENIKLAKSEGYYSYVGHFYNHLGVYYAYKGKLDKGRECYENSIESFDKVKNYIESTRAINNIGVIYSDHYDKVFKAMEYFEKGLKISREYNSLKNQVVFLINIGESHLCLNQYEKAKKHLLEAQRVAREVGDEVHLFGINISLGRIYLKLGELNKCLKQYKIIKEMFEKHPEQGENVEQYYRFLSELYLTLGKWDDALESCDNLEKSTKKVKMKHIAEYRKLIINFHRDGFLNKKLINKCISKVKSQKLFSILRKFLLEFVYISLLAGDEKYAKELLEEDEKYAKEFKTDFLDLHRSLLIAYLSEDSIDELIKLEKKAKNKYLEIEIYINRMLGNKFRDQNKYYQAIYYYIITLELFHRTVKKISDKNIGHLYLKRYNATKLLREIEKIRNDLSTEKINNQIEVEIFFKEHFDLKDFEHIFNRNAFYRAVFKHFNNLEFEHIDSIEQLVKQFTDNYRQNLELILKFAIRDTFASRGGLFIHDKDKDEIRTVTSTIDSHDMGLINQVISRVKQRGNGLLIQNTSKSEKEYVYLEDDIKALICIPILKKRELKSLKLENDRRKKNDNLNSDEIIGYIYLDSDRLFNRLNKDKYKLIETLSYLACINIENYNLKRTSSIDMLTGVYTREYFDEITKEILDKKKVEELKISVIMVDIDKFKVVNDTFGHRKGDEVLNKVGDIILNNVRSTDIVGRYGGEEFIIMLPNSDELAGKNIAENIRNKVEGAKVLGEEHPLTVSLGVSVYPKHGQSREELIEKADQALYEAKGSGRNKSVIWSNNIEKTNKRLDRLAGIVSGNTVQDRRNVLAMVEIIDLIKQDIDKDEKIYRFLGRLIEIIEGKQGIIFTLDDNQQINNVFGREIFNEEWIENPKYNESVIKKAIRDKDGEFLIDWENIDNIDILTGTPSWQSIIVTPIVYKGKLKGILQISVPIKQKEFDYNAYNFVNTLGDIIATII